jgi:membrane fusion protein (multidrug efflux system)
MKSDLPWLVVLAVCSCLGSSFAQAQGRSTAGAPIPVSTVEAAKTIWQSRLQAVGTLRAVQEVQIANEIAGRVSKISFESGDQVSAGTVLVSLDVRTEQAELKEMEAQRALAELDLGRIRRLVTQRNASEAERDAAASRLQQVDARIDAQRTLIDKMILRAPFTGTLGIRRVNLGEVLAPGTEIVTLQASDPIFVDFPVAQNALSKIAVGQPIQVRVDAYPTATFTGRVAALDARVNDESRAITVRGELANVDDQLRSGMFAEVTVPLPDQRELITLPSSAVIFSTFGDNVFLVHEKDGGGLTVKRVAVRLSGRRGDQVAVEAGLNPGDTVVVAGQVRLRDGAAVRIDNSLQLFNQADVTDVPN